MATRIELPETGVVYMDHSGHRYTLKQVDDIISGYTYFPKHWGGRQIEAFIKRYFVPYKLTIKQNKELY